MTHLFIESILRNGDTVVRLDLHHELYIQEPMMRVMEHMLTK